MNLIAPTRPGANASSQRHGEQSSNEVNLSAMGIMSKLKNRILLIPELMKDNLSDEDLDLLSCVHNSLNSQILSFEIATLSRDAKNIIYFGLIEQAEQTIETFDSVFLN